MRKIILILLLLLTITACTQTQEQTTEIQENQQAQLIESEEVIEEILEEQVEESPKQVGLEDKTCSLQTQAKTHEVELDQTIADEFGTTIDADNMQGLFEGLININIDDVSKDYTLKEEIRLGDEFKPETTLSFDNSDNFGDDIFIPILRDEISYYITFQDGLAEGNRITDATESESITLPFLGQELEIISATANSLTVLAPTKYRVEAGETIYLNGDEVTLVQTGTTSATIEVNGIREVVQDTAQERINGIEVKVQDITNEEGIEYDEATLIIGADAQTTVSDGEEYFGEDQDDPLWVWDLDNLNQQLPTIGITVPTNIDNPNEGPVYEGDAICLPHHYFCLVYEKTNTDDYEEFTLDTQTKELFASQEDVNNNDPQVTGARVLAFETTSGNGFERGSTKVETLFFYHNGTELRVYEKLENHAVLATTITSTGGQHTLYNGKAEVPIRFTVTGTTATMTLDFSVGEDLIIYFETENTNEINYLGHSNGDENTADDILYGTKDISGFERDVRLGSGAILEDPKAHQNSDDLRIKVPDRINDFSISMKANINQILCI